MKPPRLAALGRGFTYLGVMFLVALLALTSALAGAVWTTVQRRENERELAFVGRQFQMAIQSYRLRSRASALAYPLRLEDLLADTRDARVMRHLRRMYRDPIDGQARWGLLKRQDGGIVGVYSLADGVPLQRREIGYGLSFPRARSYRDWRFVALGAEGEVTATEPNADRATSDAEEGRPSPAPDAPVVPPPQTQSNSEPPSAVRPSQRDYRDRSPEACRRIETYERELCADVAVRIGGEAGRDCQVSAQERAAVCALGEDFPLPPLIVSPK